MAINELLPFAVAPSANVMTQAEYVALTARAGGFVSGVAQSEQLNKVWRQAAFVAAMIGQYTANNSDEDVLDNGDVDTFEQNFALAVAATAVGSLPFATAAEVLAATLANRVVSPKTLAPAVQSGKWNYAVAAGTANALTVTLDPALSAHIVGLPLRVLPSAVNTGPVTLNAGPGALPVMTMRGQQLQAGDLVPVPTQLICAGDRWVLAGLAMSEVPRQVLSDLTFYVRPDGNDNNDGSANTPAKAFATPQGAVDYINRTYASSSYRATINVAAGVYPHLSIARSPMPLRFISTDGFTGIIRGSAVAAGLSTINVSGYANATFEGFSIDSPNAGTYGVVVDNATITLDTISYRAAPIASVVAGTNASVTLRGANVLSGGGRQAFLRAQTGGLIESSITSPPSVQINEVMSFSAGFCQAYTNATIAVPSMTFVGFSNGQGKKYDVSLTSLISVNGAGVNFLPGTVAGTSASGGVYA